jgi:PAS domain S-box-containing protein
VIKRLILNRRRKLVLLIGTTGILVLLGGHFLRRDHIDRDRIYTIKYGTDAPFHFRGPDGAPAGLAVDVVSEAARRARIKLQWVQNSGGEPWDLWVLQTIRPDLLTTHHFSEPYLQTSTWFVVPVESSIRGPEDLAKARISYVDFAIHRINLGRLLPAMKPVPVLTSREALEKVALGQADAAYVNEYAVMPALLQGALPQAMRIIPSPAPRSLMAVSAKRPLAAVADAIRQEMRSMVDDGTLAKLINRWGWFPNLTADMVSELVTAQRRLQRVQASLVAISLVLLAVVWLAIRSRRQAIKLLRTETALQEKEAWLQTLMEQAGDGVEVLDAEGRFLQVNSTTCRQLGYAPAELLGLGISDIDPAMTRENYAERFQSLVGHSPRTFETKHRRKDGSTFPVEITFSVVSLGGVSRALAITRDITARKVLEEQLRQAQKMEAIGQLAGGVAHDFNNILMAMMLNLEMLQRDSNLDRPTREVIAELMADAKRAAQLTRQLLVFSRRSVLETRILDLNEVVANLLKMLGRLLGEHITLVFERREPLPRVRADGGMLEQVLLNLVVNARDAMPGGGRITLATQASEFTPAEAACHPNRRPGHFVCLTVTDTGCGMDSGTLERIFEPFFTTKGPGRGTGLGLATVYSILAQHQGWVEVKSTVDAGTSFHVYLPVTTDDQPEPEVTPPPAVPHGHHTLLVVEDDPGVRLLLSRVLHSLNYQVLEATNGPEAVRLWQEHRDRIDLLFTDMVMPHGMSGLALAQLLRAERPELPVIIASGYTTEIAELSDAVAHGIVYLPKPFELAELGRTLQRCLERPT